MTLDQLQDALDDSFGDGPPIAPPAARLASGQAALRRRRRLATGASVVGVAAVVVASFAVAGSGGPDRRGADPAGPAPSASPSVDGDISEAELQAELDRLAAEAKEHAEKVRKARLVSNQFPASLDPEDGSLILKKGWEVVQQVAEPVGFAPPEQSLGVVVTDGETTRWMLLTLEQVYDQNNNPIVGEVSPAASADPPNKGYSRYEDWLASMVAISGGPAQDPLVTVGADDVVQAGPGATIVEVQEIEVIEGYTDPGDRVAEVTTADGHTWFAVIRGHGAQAEVIPVDADVLPHATLAALLAYVGQQAQSGEGVR